LEYDWAILTHGWAVWIRSYLRERQKYRFHQISKSPDHGPFPRRLTTTTATIIVIAAGVLARHAVAMGLAHIP
jgi:hypothetical protein